MLLIRFFINKYREYFKSINVISNLNKFITLFFTDFLNVYACITYYILQQHNLELANIFNIPVKLD